MDWPTMASCVASGEKLVTIEGVVYRIDNFVDINPGGWQMLQFLSDCAVTLASRCNVYKHSPFNTSLQKLMTYTASPEQPVCGGPRYFFDFAKCMHLYENIHQFSHPTRSSLSIRWFIWYMYSLTHKFSGFPSCHSTSPSKFRIYNGFTPFIHNSLHVYWYSLVLITVLAGLNAFGMHVQFDLQYSSNEPALNLQRVITTKTSHFLPSRDHS